jgi:hypothetical protein
LRALLVGSTHPRRRGPRRHRDAGIASVDWHDSRWLGVALLILLLSLSDAFLTLMLIATGASEANPFMQSLVAGSGRAFALWKLGLTSIGVVSLTLLVQVRAFGTYVAGFILYAVLAAYLALVGYEFWLLDRATS